MNKFKVGDNVLYKGVSFKIEEVIDSDTYGYNKGYFYIIKNLTTYINCMDEDSLELV